MCVCHSNDAERGSDEALAALRQKLTNPKQDQADPRTLKDELMLLEESISYLDEALSVHIKELDPILRDSDPMAETGPFETSSTQVGALVVRLTDRVREMNQTLRETTRRVNL